MCVSPSWVWVLQGPSYVKVPVPCKVCWRCRKNRVNDYTGRALCEAVYSEAVSAITLTYAPRDDLADKVITPEHFQKFIRALRRRGHKLRYIATAEYGAKKGRAHFHAILFWRKPDKAGVPLMPDMPHKQNFYFDSGIWDHGHAFSDNMGRNMLDEAPIRYVCKYLLKDTGTDNDSDRWFTLSKKPPIGADFFIDKAKRDAALGVFPSRFQYRPPMGKDNRDYLLTGATRRFYLEALIDEMALRNNVPKKQLNEWVLKGVEKLERWQLEQEIAAQDPEHQLEIMRERMLAAQTPLRKTDAVAAFHGYQAELKYSEELEDFRLQQDRFHPYSQTYARFAALLQKELSEWLGKANGVNGPN